MAADLSYTSVATPLGDLTIVASEAGIVATGFGGERETLAEVERRFETDTRRRDRALAAARKEAQAYFGRTVRVLRHPVDLDFAGDGFFRRAYEAAMRVPFGEMRTYGDVASDAGSPRAWRAVGHAMAVSPIELWIPCHRVVPAGPGLGTYGGHPDRRAYLLRHEGAI
jgi:methylated-DNA-[protein]-cysteine S-methyltransferase